MKERKLSAWEVIRNKFPENEYVLIEEVPDASGFSRSRSLDFMVINLWQSRGLAVTGIERKSNRGDWLKEIKQPQKQENHFKYCDYFYLLTDKEDVARLEEIPECWGWYHINGSQIVKTMKPAPKLNPLIIERSLLCAMMRRAADKTKFIREETLESHIQGRAENLRVQKNYQLENTASAYTKLRKNVDDFEKASGLNITHSWDDLKISQMGKIVNSLLNGGIEQYKESLDRLEKQVKSIHDGIVEKIKILKQSDTTMPDSNSKV